VSWRDVLVLYRYELRSALRDRTIVINSVLIPIFLYPALIWVAMTGLTFVIGQTEGFVSRVAIGEVPDSHQKLESRLSRDDQISLETHDRDREMAVGRIRNGELEALLEILPAGGTAGALADNFRVRVTYDGSRDRSSQARQHLEETLSDYRTDWMRREAERLGLTDADWRQFELDRRNLATRRQMGAYMMGLMLPLFLVIMVAVGCFHPAIDATAGERERGTWETLMTVAARRSSLVAGKYLYVATMGAVAGLLNVAAMTLSMNAILAPLMREEGVTFEFDFPLRAVPVLAAGTILLALFVAAGMMILASFARTFREGQSLVSPFYIVIILPVLFLQDEGTAFTARPWGGSTCRSSACPCWSRPWRSVCASGWRHPSCAWRTSWPAPTVAAC
jgi:sodium transport system permease protein